MNGAMSDKIRRPYFFGKMKFCNSYFFWECVVKKYKNRIYAQNYLIGKYVIENEEKRDNETQIGTIS